MNTEISNNKEEQLEDLPDFYHVTLNPAGKKSIFRCGACWRLLFRGEKVLKHKNRKYTFYCTGSKHIESSDEYLKYLVEVQSKELGIEYLTGQLEQMVIEWSSHRHRNKVEILSVTELPTDNPKRKEVEEYRKKKAITALEKQLAEIQDAHKTEVQKIYGQIAEIENS
tara:strand:+ start:320 stop:823 length:504 start_codon:yes stop_codon:yes gene_type:complete